MKNLEELPLAVREALLDASDERDAKSKLFRIGYTCAIVNGDVDISSIKEREKDFRRVTNQEMKSFGKVVEVVRTIGWKCVCLFEGSEREYIINKGSLQRISQNS
jgi:restriction endonuclease S subunit